MKTSELLELFRLETDDTAEPYLWSDSEFYTYLNDAQDVFVRLIGGIADRRSPLTRIKYKIGDQFKKYDERILHIKAAKDANGDRVVVQNFESLDGGGNLQDDYGLFSNSGVDDSKTGPVRYILTDVQSDDIQLYPIPDADGELRLFVYRRPLEEIVSVATDLEVASFHHLNLLNWVKYKAYMKQDVETFDKTKALEFRVAFVDGVASARKEKASREDRKRVVQYGGIPMS
jgi:hypothetical protein